ncbi:NAD(+)/NADH kinase [Desulfosarcina sp. OttesenSCG-928-A07]|nr:NAD(+)/NADH kinase [Desulfosarcina sp. OttesenSCG-928-A07]
MEQSGMGKKIGLVVKNEPRALRQADEFENWLKARDVTVIRRQNEETALSPEPAPDALFCVFVLGGDGTFLSAVRWLGNQQAPILGVKFGAVGFLAETTEDRLCEVAEAIFENRFSIRLQMRLDVCVFRGKTKIAENQAFNDVVINKGALARLARICAHINDQFLTSYRADGLIVATPTGSTAYSLAAGGPIIHPSVPGILITPICPFTLTNRPLMVPDDSVITIRLTEDASDIMLTCDGQVGMKIDEYDTLIIRKSPNPVQMITLPDQNYFDVLKTKLKWG